MIYLDNSATTRPSDGVVRAMTAALTDTWANPSSVHGAGGEAKRILDSARDTVMNALGVKRKSDGRIIFTSGGTEANNLAVFGVARAKNRPSKNGSRGIVMISDGEHPSVDNPASVLESEGFTVLRIPTKNGVLDLDFIKEHATSDVIFASIMLANNETGAVYDVRSASDIIKSASPSAVVHADCVQAFMKMKFSPASLKADAVTVSAHKICGPKGVGALFITEEIVRTKRLVPTVFGGGQEEMRRPGTENLPGIAGFAQAIREATAEFDMRCDTLNKLRAEADSALGKLSEIRINKPAEKYLPGVINVTLPKIKSETMLNALSGRGICVSAGSACSARQAHVSRALLAFGLTKDEADCSLRISMNHENTPADVAALAEALAAECARLQRIRR